MKTAKDIVWTRLLPDEPRAFDRKEWLRSGGKWIVFDSREAIETLAEKLAPFINSGEIESAKLWNGDPSAINVYSLDSERGKVREILKKAGSRYVLVWEYDYAMARNFLHPFTFTYSSPSPIHGSRSFGPFSRAMVSRGLCGS